MTIPGLFVIVALSLAGAFQTETQTGASARIEGEAQVESTVGIPVQVLQVIYPGPELEVRDVDPRTTPIVLRIDAVYPHGADYRYDLTWSGMEAGTFNLTDYLRRKDGTESTDLPACTVTVKSVLAPDSIDIQLDIPEKGLIPATYRSAWLIGGIVWVVGLLGFIFLGRRRQPSSVQPAPEDIARAKLRRIEQLIETAMREPAFSVQQKAELDLLIVDFWRERRDLTGVAPDKAIQTLRNDPEAGPLLQRAERWLYDRPENTSREEISALLAPLRELVREAAIKGRPSLSGTGTASGRETGTSKAAEGGRG
ncbi:MAG: hypothetical protein JNL58_16965 [Planctomyces sp.]|nr:hypothetical protein [Planctomyces sp.]